MYLYSASFTEMTQVIEIINLGPKGPSYFIFYIVNTTAVDDLATEGSTASAIIVLINFSGPCMSFGTFGSQSFIPLTHWDKIPIIS